MKCDASRTFIIATLLTLALPLAAVSIDAQNKKSESTDLYKSKPGKFETKIVDQISLQEKKREQPLPLRVTYPVTAADQKLPVIIFSHGAGGSRKIINRWLNTGPVTATFAFNQLTAIQFRCCRAANGENIDPSANTSTVVCWGNTN